MTDNSGVLNYEFSFKLFGVLLAAFLAAVLLIGSAVADETPLTFYETMTAIGVLASIALTGTLAYLYYRMSQIQDLQREEGERQADLQQELADNQDKQNELLELQQEMMELEYQPKILIDEYELKPSGVEITLRNLGRGLAEHIAVRTNLYIEDIPDELRSHQPELAGDHILHEPEVVFYRDPETDVEYVPNVNLTVRTEGEEFMAKRRRGGMLSPDEGAVKFVSGVRFGMVEPGRDSIRDVLPNRFFEELYDAGLRDVRFDLDLVYCSELGDVFVSPILGASGELTEDTGLENIEELRYGSSGSRTLLREIMERTNRYPPPL